MQSAKALGKAMNAQGPGSPDEVLLSRDTSSVACGCEGDTCRATIHGVSSFAYLGLVLASLDVACCTAHELRNRWKSLKCKSPSRKEVRCMLFLLATFEDEALGLFALLRSAPEGESANK